jgi:heme-degrading monooxygenase HmoA
MVEFVNCFEVPAGREEEFFELWKQVNAYMVVKPGYVSHQLLRSLGPDARFRFVNLAKWDSVQALRAGHDEGFKALISSPEWADFRSLPAPYEVVHENARLAS